MYLFTPLEDYVRNLYESLSILTPEQLDMKLIAEKLGVTIHYYDEESEASCIGGKLRIFLNDALNENEMWQDFAHELCHVLRHAGNQSGTSMPTPFRLLQESQAKNFAMHFCVPTFMLLEIDLPKYRNQAVLRVSEIFNVTFDFAFERIRHYENQVTGALFFKEMHQSKKHQPLKEEPKVIDLYEDLPYYERQEYKDFIKELIDYDFSKEQAEFIAKRMFRPNKKRTS